MEISATIIVYSGQDQQKATGDLFGYHTKPNEPHLKYPDKTHEFDGDKIIYKNSYAREAIDVPQDINIILDIAKDIGIGLISAYLYDKLSSFKKTKVRIGNKENDIIKDEIHKAIKEEFDKQRENKKE